MPSCPLSGANLSFGTFVAPTFSESRSLGEGNQATYVQLKIQLGGIDYVTSNV